MFVDINFVSAPTLIHTGFIFPPGNDLDTKTIIKLATLGQDWI